MTTFSMILVMLAIPNIISASSPDEYDIPNNINIVNVDNLIEIDGEIKYDNLSAFVDSIFLLSKSSRCLMCFSKDMKIKWKREIDMSKHDSIYDILALNDEKTIIVFENKFIIASEFDQITYPNNIGAYHVSIINDSLYTRSLFPASERFRDKIIKFDVVNNKYEIVGNSKWLVNDISARAQGGVFRAGEDYSVYASTFSSKYLIVSSGGNSEMFEFNYEPLKNRHNYNQNPDRKEGTGYKRTKYYAIFRYLVIANSYLITSVPDRDYDYMFVWKYSGEMVDALGFPEYRIKDISFVQKSHSSIALLLQRSDGKQV